MSFVSKAQAAKAFATGGFGGKIDPHEWAAKTKSINSLPERINPPKKKKNVKLFG